MRVLLDENIPHVLRYRLPGHEVTTASYAGFAGLKNGQLLDAAEAVGFAVLVTGDRTLHYEQNLTGRTIAIVALSAISWTVMEPYMLQIAAAVDHAARGSFIQVHCGEFSRHRGVGP